jgi:hypothetical protein
VLCVVCSTQSHQYIFLQMWFSWSKDKV